MNRDQQKPVDGVVEDLDRDVKAGDERALAALFEHYRPRLRRIVDARMDQRLRGRVDPADLLQDTFLDLSRKLSEFAAGDKVMSPFVWMRLVATERVLIAHRRHLDARMRDARREVSRMPASGAETSSAILANHLLAHFSSVGHRAIRDEMSKTLITTLEAMSELDREIITMRSFEELTNAEAAEALDISENGASSRYVRAMTRLKQALAAIPGFMD